MDGYTSKNRKDKENNNEKHWTLEDETWISQMKQHSTKRNVSKMRINC